MWGKVSCLRKQHDGRDWALNHRPSDLTSNALTTSPPHPSPAPKVVEANPRSLFSDTLRVSDGECCRFLCESTTVDWTEEDI